ncbi:MAG: hypothetical protein K6G88_13825 [Lachnospiraceae bacterium]|nr:hypothetical protein [Lachnospiraceae bacterium]
MTNSTAQTTDINSTTAASQKYSTHYCLIIYGAISILMMCFMFLRRALIDDGPFHFGRLCALSNEISLSNLRPAIYSDTFFHTGYPLGIYYPDIFMYPFALLGKLGISKYVLFVLFLMCINFASAASIFYSLKKILFYNNVKYYQHIAFVSGIIYLAFPYRLYDMYIRMAIGECMAFIFIPIVVLGVYEIFYNNKFGLCLFFGMTGLAHSHILSVAMTAVVLLAFYILNVKKLIKNPKIIVNTAFNAVLTILCTLSIILPILEMQTFTTLYYQTGIKTFGLLETHCIHLIGNDIISLIVTAIISVACIILQARLHTNGRLILATLYFIFMCTDAFCWGFLEHYIPALNTLQFPFRLLVFTGIPLSYYFGKLLYVHKPLYISIPVILLSGLIFLSYVKYLPIDTVDIYGLYSVGQGEYLNQDFRNYFIIDESIDGIYKEFDIKRNDNTYTFTADNGTVVLPVGYYKGYRVTDNKGNKYEYTSRDGLLKIDNVKVDTLTVKYIGTAVQKVSLFVSLITFIVTCFMACRLRKKEE